MPFITLVACGYQRKKGIVLIPLSVIPLGFEPKTHSLEGCCSNPTELRNPYI